MIDLLINAESCLKKHSSYFFRCKLFKLFCVLDSVLKLLTSICEKLIVIGNTLALDKLVIDNNACLNVLKKCVELVIESNNIAEPDIISYRIILAEFGALLKYFCIRVGKDKLESCAILYCLKKRVINISFHVDRCSCELNVTVKHHSKERNRCVRLSVTAGVERDIGDMINVLPRECVAARGHYAVVVLIKILKRFDSKVLGVCAVVRLILIKVRVEVLTERGYRDSYGIVLEVVLSKLFVESVEICRRDRQLEVAYISLLCCAVYTLTCISVIDRLYCVGLKGKSVKECVGGRKHEIEIREYSYALFLREGYQLFKSLASANSLFPFELVRNCGLGHTALGITCKNEVDILDALCAELVVHRLDVLERRKRCHCLYRYREYLLSCLNSSECFDIYGDIVLYVFSGKLCEYLVSLEVISVCLCHSNVIAAVVVGNSLVCRNLVVGKHYVSYLVVAGVLSRGYDRPRVIRTYRDRLCEVVCILRSGIYRHLKGVVRIASYRVEGGKLHKSVTLFNDSKESALLLGLYCFGFSRGCY